MFRFALVLVLSFGTLAAETLESKTTDTAYSGTWRGLVLSPENRCTEYAASEYRYPSSVENDIVASYGGVYSPYTGAWFDTQTETDIDHVVARSEAHDSGMCSANAGTKKAFARDLLNLTLSDPVLNRSVKSDKDAAEYLPVSNRCWFAHTVLCVKMKYNLTVDILEAAALESVLSSCPSVAMQFSRRSMQFSRR